MIKFTKNKLAIFYVICKYNNDEVARLRSAGVPEERWPSSIKKLTVQMIAGSKDNWQAGLYNQFVTQYHVTYTYRSFAPFYTAFTHFELMGIVNPRENDDKGVPSPNTTGWNIYNQLLKGRHPRTWPTEIDVVKFKGI